MRDLMRQPPWDTAKLGREALAHADTLHNLARYPTGNATDAEDLVQETYFRAPKAASQFAPGTNLKSLVGPHSEEHVHQPRPSPAS
jgi:DNA-directed RNA polymerase specialized sigma24 family protein